MDIRYYNVYIHCFNDFVNIFSILFSKLIHVKVYNLLQKNSAVYIGGFFGGC